MTQYKLLVLDLDGTLTNSEKIITPRTLESLMNAQKKGARVVLASGRPTFGIMPLARQLRLADYGGFILSYNGGQIIDCSDNNKIIFQQSVPKEEIEPLYNLAKEFGLTIMSYRGDSIISENPSDKWLNIEAKINNMPVEGVEDFARAICQPVTKCLIVGDPAVVELAQKKGRQMFDQRLNLFTSAPYFLECVPKGIDKAESIARLLRVLGLAKEQVVACGDGYNDLSMIEFAGLGVAMGNAQSGVMQAADFITLSNDDDGVAYVVNNYILHNNKLRRMLCGGYWKLKWQHYKRKK